MAPRRKSVPDAGLLDRMLGFAVLVCMSTLNLDKLLDHFLKPITPENAVQLLAFRIDPTTQARVDELARAANEDTLTAAEKLE